MSTELYTPEQCVAIERAGQRFTRMAYGLALPVLYTGVQITCVGVVMAVDYGLMLEGISYIKAALPGEEQTFSPHLLALCGTVVILGAHLRSEEKPRSASMRVIERCMDVAIPIFALGVGGMFAASLWFDGLDGMFGSTGSRELMSLDPGATEPPFFSGVFSMFGLPFVIGAAGLGAVTLYCASHLIRSIRRNLGEISDRLYRVKEGLGALRMVRNCQKLFSKQMRERIKAGVVDERAVQIQSAMDIVAARNRAIAPYETWLGDEALRKTAPEARFVTKEFDFDRDEMKARIDAERAITAKHILALIRSELK